MRTISAADANRKFSSLLRDVQAGESVTVTSRGVPVATLAPANRTPERTDAKEALIARLRSQAPAGLTFRRDELYDE